MTHLSVKLVREPTPIVNIIGWFIPLPGRKFPPAFDRHIRLSDALELLSQTSLRPSPPIAPSSLPPLTCTTLNFGPLNPPPVAPSPLAIGT